MKDQKQTTKTKYSDVTAADVKKCKGYEGISDELAESIADAIRVYTEVIYNCFKEQRIEAGKAKVITMGQRENKKAA